MGYITTFCGDIRFNIDISDDTAEILKGQFIEWELKRLCYCPWTIQKDHRGKWVMRCEDCKVRDYIIWLKILIGKLSKFYVLNGTVLWRGEDYTDNGKMVITNNILTVHKGIYVVCED